MKEMLFILNPKAGTKKANKALVDILNIFNRADYRVQVYITAGAKDAISAVKQFAPGKDLVVCCGGDGTFNETVTGMLDAGLDLPIGYIPAGSTNDFANSIGLPSSLTAAAEQIVNGAPMRLDVGRLGEQYFCYVTSFGAFTRASYNTSQNAKNTLGHAAYLLEGLSELPQIRKKNMRFELDGEVLEDDYIFGAVCNSTSLGG
ncbi:MAG: YegS/Rv2252/BmrU family lipid kinase, partial [Oscillospiraceae bacterium]|nr:YegS/Rv2252/BmrU family lipid kinase [Oscillospiraceae bacterium]